jgi:hypothetical protein
MSKPQLPQKPAPPGTPAITKDNYLSLAGFLEGKDRIQRVQKKEPHSEALRTAGEAYANHDYVAAYECLKPVHTKVVADMQRVLARNLDFEANKLAKEQRKPLAVAKENVQSMKVYAQQVIDQFDRLLKDLEGKALVRVHLKKRRSADTATPPLAEEAPPTILASASETRVDANTAHPAAVVIAGKRYKKAPYLRPELAAIYCVRDKAGGQRIVRVVAKSPDGDQVQVEILDEAKASKPPIKLAVDSLSRQAAKGWCSLLVPEVQEASVEAVASTELSQASDADVPANATMRLDIQNFSRCCADIIRANIKFDTQRIKDIGDGPFRGGDFEQAFLAFEQLTTGFNSAVAASRRAIADGRRLLTAKKGELSGKEIQDQTAAFTRSEALIHTAEREFSTTLEGLRMYLRARQARANEAE